jgi:hypothetical protein
MNDLKVSVAACAGLAAAIISLVLKAQNKRMVAAEVMVKAAAVN